MEKRTLLDEERKKAIQEELEQIKKNYDTARKDYNKAQDELNVLLADSDKIHELHRLNKADKEQCNFYFNFYFKAHITFIKNTHIFNQKLI